MLRGRFEGRNREAVGEDARRNSALHHMQRVVPFALNENLQVSPAAISEVLYDTLFTFPGQFRVLAGV